MVESTGPEPAPPLARNCDAIDSVQPWPTQPSGFLREYSDGILPLDPPKKPWRGVAFSSLTDIILISAATERALSGAHTELTFILFFFFVIGSAQLTVGALRSSI